MSGDMSFPPGFRLQQNLESASLPQDPSSSRIKKLITLFESSISESDAASLKGRTVSTKENSLVAATARNLLGMSSSKGALSSTILLLQEKGSSLSDKEFETACNSLAKSVADFALKQPNEREFFLQCKIDLLLLTPDKTARNKSTHLYLKVAEHILNYESPSTESFDTRVAQAAQKFEITDEMAAKEAKLLGCSQNEATLSMLNRVYSRKHVLNPHTPSHTPSLARKAEETGFSPSLIRTIEKGFSRYLKAPEQSPTKITAENVTVYYHGRGEVLVEQKQLDSGGFKVVNIALDYFSAIEESDSDVVTAKPKNREESSSSTIDEDTSFARFDPNAEESGGGDLLPLSFSDSSVQPDDGFNSIVFSEQEEPETPLEPTPVDNVARALEGSIPLKDLTLSEMQEYCLKQSDKTEIDQLIAKRERDIEIKNSHKPLSAEKNYEREIELTQKLQGPGVVRVRKVVELDEGNKMMVMDRAGYTLDALEGYREKPTTVINLDDMVALYHKKMLAPQEISQLVQMCRETIQSVANLHDKGYIHRDLKSVNVLLSKQGTALLSDFGTAVKEAGDPEKIHYIGTVYYSAPESFIYEGSERWDNLSKQSDVWSLGMMLQDIFMHDTGGLLAHPAIDKTSFVFALIKKYADYEEPKEQAAYNARYPEPADKNSLEHLIWSATRLDPDQRPTIHEFQRRFIELTS